jgi:hypothetical protein
MTGDTNGYATTYIMAFRIISHTVDTHKIALVLDGTGLSEHLPGLLTGVGPVGHQDDGVILPPRSITAPTGEAEVIASEQQKAETSIFHDGMVISRCIALVLMTIGEEVMLVVNNLMTGAAVDEIVAIDIMSVSETNGQAATHGTMMALCGSHHPLKGCVVAFWMSDALWLRGKTGAPHLGQHIEV